MFQEFLQHEFIIFFYSFLAFLEFEKIEMLSHNVAWTKDQFEAKFSLHYCSDSQHFTLSNKLNVFQLNNFLVPNHEKNFVEHIIIGPELVKYLLIMQRMDVALHHVLVILSEILLVIITLPLGVI